MLAGDLGSRGWDPWIRRLGSVDPEAGIMDPEAGIHGSGGWDPWIRRLGPMDPEAGIHGSEPPKPASAGLGRPAGGRGPEVQKERKSVKSSRKWRHFVTTTPDAYTAPALGTLFGARSAHLREKCVLRTFPTFSHFWSISTRENISPNGHFHFGAKRSEKVIFFVQDAFCRF